MSAYATARIERSIPSIRPNPSRLSVSQSTFQSAPRSAPGAVGTGDDDLLVVLVDRLVERIAIAVASRLATPSDHQQREWFDSRGAAEYLGVHRDTLRKLAAERAIPSEQDGPGCKLFFRRSDLDVWRQSGGRPAGLVSLLATAA